MLEVHRMENPGGFEPLTEGLKVPCKTILLYVRGPNSGPAFGVPRCSNSSLLSITAQYFDTFLGQAVNAIRQLFSHGVILVGSPRRFRSAFPRLSGECLSH